MASRPRTPLVESYYTAYQQLKTITDRLSCDADESRRKAQEAMKERDDYKSFCHTLRMKLDFEHRSRLFVEGISEGQKLKIQQLEVENDQLQQQNLAMAARYESGYGQTVRFASAGPPARGLLPEAAHYAVLDGSAPAPADVRTSTKRKAEHEPEAYTHQGHREWSVIESDRAADERALQTTQVDGTVDWTVGEA